MTTEEYRICFEDYEISNLGNCRKKLKTGVYITIIGSVNNRGYRYFQIQRNGKRLNKLYHQMVAQCFLGDRPHNFDIDHIDRDKANNILLNLRYVSHLDNMKNQDRYHHECNLQGPERKKYIINQCVKKLKESKKYYCTVCDIKCDSPSKLTKHLNTKKHINTILP